MKKVIFVAGLIGTGKTTLAETLAKRLDIPYLDVDKIKKEIYPTDPQYEYNLKNNIPFSNETRIKVFNSVALHIKELSEGNQSIVVDETLHNRMTRQILFDAAEKYFDGYTLLWVDADEEVVRERLENKAREGHILNDAFGMYLSLKKGFEPFDPPYIKVLNNGDIEDVLKGAIEKLKSDLNF